MPGSRTTRITRTIGLVVTLVLCGADPTQAAFTRTDCLAQKRSTQGKFRQCRAKQQAKALLGKPADVATCMTKFRDKIAKLSAKASELGIACRFVDNGNSITDYDTALQWVETNNLDNVADFANPQDADNSYSWTSTGTAADGTIFTDYLYRLNACTSADGTTPLFAGFAGSCDWRIPSIAELQTILLAPYPCATDPCIDPIFGPTRGTFSYFTSEMLASDGTRAWSVTFGDGFLGTIQKPNANYVRAVRGGL